jgi:hypothetical protein
VENGGISASQTINKDTKVVIPEQGFLVHANGSAKQNIAAKGGLKAKMLSASTSDEDHILLI